MVKGGIQVRGGDGRARSTGWSDLGRACGQSETRGRDREKQVSGVG